MLVFHVKWWNQNLSCIYVQGCTGIKVAVPGGPPMRRLPTATEYGQARALPPALVAFLASRHDNWSSMRGCSSGPSAVVLHHPAAGGWGEQGGMEASKGTAAGEQRLIQPCMLRLAPVQGSLVLLRASQDSSDASQCAIANAGPCGIVCCQRRQQRQRRWHHSAGLPLC